MSKIKAGLFFVVLFSFFISLSSFAAAGCCVSPEGCEQALSLSGCTGAPGTIVFDSSLDCTAKPECARVCCCADSKGKYSISCTGDKVVNQSLSLGQSCSCPSSATYSVSGIVKLNGNPFVGATVSSGGIIAKSLAGGLFTLDNVPSGTFSVNALIVNCTGTTIFSPALNQDIAGVSINLSCTCTENECNYDYNARCISGSWVFYDLNIPSQNASYCGSLCGGPTGDLDCGVNPCRANDGSCPMICTTTPGVNYDADCICSNVSNGACPGACSRIIGTSNYDVDCSDFFSMRCGDGIVSYPYESCEKNAPVLGLCSDEYCENCNCVNLAGCGNMILEASEDCELGIICADGSACGAGCKCGAAKCGGALTTPLLYLNFSLASKSIFLKWSFDPACAPSVSGIEIFKCEKKAASDCLNKSSFENMNLGLSRDKLNYSDAVKQNSEFYYYVQARYLNSVPAIGESLIKSQKSGDFICMERLGAGNTGEFCIYNKRSRCKPDYNIETVQDCNLNKSLFCMGPDSLGITTCSGQGVCDLCNGLYGMYANLDLSVWVDQAGSQVSKFCMPGAGRDLVNGCYIDRTKTLFDSFKYCANVASCYDYKSEAACTSDPCDKIKNCEWQRLGNNYLYGGICRPNNPSLQNCLLCDDPEYNWATPACSPDSCPLFGENCHFQGLDASSYSCADRVTASCRDYGNDSVRCGTTPVLVNATYLNGIRINGSHAVFPGNDALGLGKCYFDSVNKRCLRNADNLAGNYTSNTGFDCAINDYYCESDFSSPVTTIIPTTFGTHPSDVSISYSVSDNYPGNKISTYFCISSSRCYPTNLASNNEYREKIPLSGRYYVYYYSVDPAKNLEIVKNTTILVDADAPIIDLLDPANASDFVTNKAIMTVKGKTTLDAAFVCANNLVTKKTVCINNCANPALTRGIKKMECFSNTTGIFDLPINLGNSSNVNSARDIVFYSEDFVGNKYNNTMYGIIYDIEPPSAPTIQIR